MRTVKSTKSLAELMSATMTKSIYIRVARRRLQPDQRRLERTNDGVAAVPPVGGVGGIGGAGSAGGAGGAGCQLAAEQCCSSIPRMCHNNDPLVPPSKICS